MRAESTARWVDQSPDVSIHDYARQPLTSRLIAVG